MLQSSWHWAFEPDVTEKNLVGRDFQPDITDCKFLGIDFEQNVTEEVGWYWLWAKSYRGWLALILNQMLQFRFSASALNQILQNVHFLH